MKRKIIALLLCIVCVVSLCFPVAADDDGYSAIVSEKRALLVVQLFMLLGVRLPVPRSSLKFRILVKLRFLPALVHSLEFI